MLHIPLLWEAKQVTACILNPLPVSGRLGNCRAEGNRVEKLPNRQLWVPWSSNPNLAPTGADFRTLP